jgi:hypothetical protein
LTFLLLWCWDTNCKDYKNGQAGAITWKLKRKLEKSTAGKKVALLLMAGSGKFFFSLFLNHVLIPTSWTHSDYRKRMRDNHSFPLTLFAGSLFFFISFFLLLLSLFHLHTLQDKLRNADAVGLCVFLH